jgi:hypothetical protein
MARPSPVPPNFCPVAASAWVNSSRVDADRVKLRAKPVPAGLPVQPNRYNSSPWQSLPAGIARTRMRVHGGRSSHGIHWPRRRIGTWFALGLSWPRALKSCLGTHCTRSAWGSMSSPHSNDKRQGHSHESHAPDVKSEKPRKSRERKRSKRVKRQQPECKEKYRECQCRANRKQHHKLSKPSARH